MSNYVGPEIPNDGLICMLDAANIKSYDPAENLLRYSQQLNTSPWNKYAPNSNITVTENDIAAPDGTVTGNKITDSNNAAGGSIYIDVAGISGTGTYTVSMFVKAGTGTTTSLGMYFLSGGTTQGFFSNFNISTGTFISGTGTVVNYGNGWYQISVTATGTSAANTVLRLEMYQQATGYLYAWGAQVNTGPYVRPYTLTTTTARAASTTWTDLTGSGYNATLFNTYFVPTDGGGAFETRGIVGSYILQSTLNLAATNYTIITATRYAAASPRGRMFNGRSNNWLLGNWGGTTQNYYAEGWVSAVGAGTADTNWRIMAGTGQIAADAYSVYVNGTNTVLNSTAGSAGPNGFVIGMTGYDLSTELTLGRCSFVLAYNRVLTSLEVSQVFQAYRGRFGI